MATTTRRQQRGWQVDWAGPHGTAWGTVNACLTTLSAACSGRLMQARWPVPEGQMVAGAIVAAVLGVIFVLLGAALRSKRTPGATIVYKICCWVGIGWWLTQMFAQDRWTMRWFLGMAGALVAMAVVAGVLAGLAADDPPKEPEEQPPSRDIPPGTPPAEAQAMRERNAIAVDIEERLTRLSNGDLTGVHVPNVEMWHRGNGYTAQANCPPGPSSWKTVDGLVDALSSDMDLEFGCRIKVKMGRTRKVALVDVMTKNFLAEEIPYPTDYPRLSIHDPLPGAVTDAGEEIGPDLRSKCMLLVGETGSGKTNAGHVIGVGVACCVDALLWDLDFTGKLFLDLLHPFMEGKTTQPPVDWAAFDEQEGLFMLRAAIRGHLARNAGYRDLMRQVNDDKIPISEELPAFIIRMDEIAAILGAPTQYPVLKELVTQLVFEARSAGFRVVLLGLRATDDVVASGIQAQCHVVAVTKASNDAEYAWAFGWHSGAKVEDAPYEGSGFISLSSGARPVAEKWRRLPPRQLVQAAVAVDGRQPTVDELTRLAFNGRNPDGTPTDGLLPGELDCYDTRWDRFRARFGGEHPSQPAAPASAPATAQPQTSAAVSSPAEAMANLATAMDALQAEVERVQGQREDDGLNDEQREKDRAEFEAILAAEGFGPDVDWSDPDNWDTEPETPAEPDDEEKLLDLIRSYGPAGGKPRDLLRELAERYGIRIHRDTLHERLRGLKAAGKVHQPSHGRWAAGPDPR